MQYFSLCSDFNTIAVLFFFFFLCAIFERCNDFMPVIGGANSRLREGLIQDLVLR